MKINVMSDLHTEFWKGQKYVEPAENMVIAGDLGHINEDDYGYKEEALIFVPGNHEYYGLNIADWYQKPNRTVVEDVEFICATLWTNFHEDWYAEKNAAKNINDFYMIKAYGSTIYGDATVSTATYKNLYYKELDYIKMCLAHPMAEKQVVVTHFLPHTMFTPERFKAQSDLNKYFAPNALDEIDEDHWPDLWIFGHTHDFIDKTINGTRFLCNPLGYPQEANITDWVEVEL